MSLKGLLLGIGIGWTVKFSWTGAESDKCLHPGCGLRRDQHDGQNHKFQEK